MKSLITKSLVSAGSFALPFLALAQSGSLFGGSGTINDFDTVFGKISLFLNNIVGLLIAVALVLFIYGLLKYIMSAGDEKARGEAKNIMIYGVIIMFMMVAVWGFVNVLSGVFFGGAVTPPTPPSIAI